MGRKPRTSGRDLYTQLLRHITPDAAGQILDSLAHSEPSESIANKIRSDLELIKQFQVADIAPAHTANRAEHQTIT